MGFEYDLIKFLQTNATTGWISFFQTITMLGSYLGFLITLIIVFVKNRRMTIPLVATFIIASVINHFLKLIVARSRPFDTYNDIINYANEDGFSFPSGHSLCSGIFATFLMLTLFKSTSNKLTRTLGTISISFLPLIVALSRMVLGVHYLSDTIVGIIFGILFAIIIILVYNKLENKWKRGKRN